MRNWNFSEDDSIEYAGVNVFTVPMRNWNCLSSHTDLSIHPVFTVPMRNWNDNNNKEAATTEVKFLQYLWGIETFTRRSSWDYGWVFTVPMRNWVLQYLWGIETCKLSATLPILKIVFTVPMRNWNCRTHNH